MDDNVFFITMWKLVAVVVVVFILTTGSCTIHQQKKIADLIAAGADPLGAQCAIYGVKSYNSAVCGILAGKGQKN